MGFGFGLLRCWMLDSGWVEMVSRRRIFFYVVALHTHREDDPYKVCEYHCLASSDESGDFVAFGQDPLGKTY